ncbi:ribonuclease H-like domain-containing protein [Tanacetum coccineum]
MGKQHMTYTDKELDNVLDISHLKIKVGHPNGTNAFISKIGNLKLSNGLVLYDVLVIPEYYVTLISVHKLVKENKIIVTFDESICYFLNQDLNLRNVMGTGNQCEGFSHPTEPVLNVLKESLQIDNKDHYVYCEICQRAKQTRELFPLSDHTSKFLGDLVHLDLWGPYKVTSSEGFRYFLTIVDDYTRQMLMVEDNVGNQFRPNAGQIAWNQNGYNVVPNVGNQLGHNVV